MRKTFGVLFMLLGVVFMLCALLMILKNEQEDYTAKAYSGDVLPAIKMQIDQERESVPAESSPVLVENIPEEFLRPEDLVMTEKMINGNSYIGYLSIPDMKLELPVMSSWDYNRLRISPCRYTGSTRGEDLVIMAHNYNSHFGRLSKLSIGAQVQFMDMDGVQWKYQVVAIDVLAAEAVEEMTAGEYDLTLFTCETNRMHRVTVRCDRIKE